jgi:hypothetical protein
LVLRCFSSQRSPLHPMHSGADTLSGGLPHSEIPGSQFGYQLPWAYRRFPRLSSPLDAKSSAICPCWLDHTNPTPRPFQAAAGWANSIEPRCVCSPWLLDFGVFRRLRPSLRRPIPPCRSMTTPTGPGAPEPEHLSVFRCQGGASRTGSPGLGHGSGWCQRPFTSAG